MNSFNLPIGARPIAPTDLFKSEALGEKGSGTAATGDTVADQIGSNPPGNMVTLGLLALGLWWTLKG